MVADLGIVASRDPVAVDQAAIDLVESRGGRKLPELIGNSKLDWSHQIRHAVKIGLGCAEYELSEIK
jgi:hypothetical protein